MSASFTSTAAAPASAGATTDLRPALWATAAAVAILALGPAFVGVFRPTPNNYPDFVQEWLSARNFWAGEPIYASQREAMRRHTGQDLPAFDVELPWNAHPPASLLVALPLGLIPDYRTAHLAWNLATFPLLVLSFLLIVRELGITLRLWSVLPIVALSLVCNPLLSQLYQGQLNLVILFLLVLGWVADRRGYQTAAGFAVGVAAAMKLFPGLLLLYFATAGRWRAVVAACASAVGLNAVALGVFGQEAFVTYMREVLPSLAVFRGSWQNVSLRAYWTRIAQASALPALGSPLALACQLAIAGMVAWTGWRAKTVDDRDRAYALALAGMPLASPVAWPHYFVLLLLPLLLLWQRLPRGWPRGALLAVAVVLWAPERIFPTLVIGRTAAAALTNVDPIPDGVALTVVGLGPLTYALVALFLLLAFARLTPAGDSPSATRTDRDNAEPRT